MSHQEMEAAESIAFLESLLGKTLHITVKDGRLFTGAFKCTDNESNVILANSFEYRMPSAAEERRAIEKAAATGINARADMTSRFVGLIVVPGDRIVKMELESRRAGSPPASSGSGSNAGLAIRTR